MTRHIHNYIYMQLDMSTDRPYVFLQSVSQTYVFRQNQNPSSRLHWLSEHKRLQIPVQWPYAHEIIDIYDIAQAEVRARTDEIQVQRLEM
jgi:hypothetical protein